MAFHDTQFPTDIAFGSASGIGFRTQVTELASGREQRVAMWSGGRMMFDVSYGIRDMADLAVVQEFFRARQGALNGFRFKDFMDFHSNPTNPTATGSLGTQDQVLGTGDGTETDFQLRKLYTEGGSSVYRIITKPVDNGSMSVWVNSVAKTEGVDYTVDYSTGIITFGTAPTSGHSVDASFEFDVPVRFSQDSDRLLSATMAAFNAGDISITLIELLEESGGYSNEYFYGGSTDNSDDGETVVNPNTAFVWRFDTASGNAKMPDPSGYQAGRPQALIIYDGAATFAVKDEGGTTILTLNPGEAAQMSIVQTGSSTYQWRAT